MRIELSTVAGGSIDAAKGIISGVSVITAGVEAIGHDVWTDAHTLATVQQCAEIYRGGLKVKLDHTNSAGAFVGTLNAFRIVGVQLKADLRLLETSPHRAYVLEIAKTMPESFGLSISFSGSREEIDGRDFFRCLEIYSCDIVDAPAANPGGLFAAAGPLPPLPARPIALGLHTMQELNWSKKKQIAHIRAEGAWLRADAIREGIVPKDEPEGYARRPLFDQTPGFWKHYIEELRFQIAEARADREARELREEISKLQGTPKESPRWSCHTIIRAHELKSHVSDLSQQLAALRGEPAQMPDTKTTQEQGHKDSGDLSALPPEKRLAALFQANR